MSLSELLGLMSHILNRFWWIFAIIGMIIIIFVMRELFFHLYFNYYLRSKKEKPARRNVRDASEDMRNLQVARVLGKISSEQFDIHKYDLKDSFSIADKQKQIKEKIGSIVATEDIHALLEKIDKKEVEPEKQPQKDDAVKTEPKPVEKEERREEKPEEIRRLGMRKARLILAIRKLDEDLSAKKISQDAHAKQRSDYISELADTEEALIEYEVKRKVGKKG